MKILLVSNKPKFGGIGIYVDGLSVELRKVGIDVAWFFVGEYDFRFKIRLHKYKDSFDVLRYELRNCPNLHAAHGNTHPRDELGNREIEDAFKSAIDEFGPQIVHFHDLGGLCSSLISIAGGKSLITVTTLNCYWFICAKNDLVNNVTGGICPGPGGGASCAICLSNAGHGLRIAKSQMLVWKALKQAVPAKVFSKIANSLLKTRQTILSLRKKKPTGHGTANQGLAEAFRERETENLRLLSEVVTLNIAVTKFVRQRFVEWGVPNERIIVQHFGTRAAEFLCRKKKRHNGIMTFGYIGPLAYHKGAHVLISAFKKLDSGSAKLVVYGNNQSDYGRKLMATDGLREVEFRGAYRHSDLQQILDNIDVMVVPPIWYDNSPQVVFEAFAAGVPVIGSDIGGIPDFVDHGVNGYLFAHGDAEELAKYMNALLADHTLLEKLSLNISPMITMKQHTVELSQLYERLVRERDILSTAN